MNLNFWQSKTMPYSWYQKNNLEHWSGTDQPENVDTNWSVPISYKFNQQGFRTHDLNMYLGQKVNVALGCSHTMGIGLPDHMTWPFIIEQSTGIPTLNLGLGQGSSDTVARILTNICDLFDIESVFILWPSVNRFELYEDNNIRSIIPSSSLIEYTWYANDPNSIQRFNKNKSIVYNLQKIYKFKLKEMVPGSTWAIHGDLARDKIHNGSKSNLNLANLFLTGVQ